MSEIRRILIALEPAFAQSQMPELAVKLAAELRAEVGALLAQGSALKMAADLPFLQEILTPTGKRRSLTRQTLDLDFGIVARNLEDRFRQLASRSGLPWSFRSVSGDPIAEIIAAASERDLLMLGMPRGATFGIAAMRGIAQQAGRPVVFLGETASPRGGVMVFDGEPESQGDLPAVIGLLARTCPGQLTIYRQPSAEHDRARPDEVLRIPTESGPAVYARISTAGSGLPGIGELRSRTVLILPGRQTDRSGVGPELA